MKHAIWILTLFLFFSCTPDEYSNIALTSSDKHIDPTVVSPEVTTETSADENIDTAAESSAVTSEESEQKVERSESKESIKQPQSHYKFDVGRNSHHSSYTDGFDEDYARHLQPSAPSFEKHIISLTNRFTTIPTASNVNHFLDLTLSSPLGGCANYVDEGGLVDAPRPSLAEKNPSARGARFLLATLYQSCDVISMPITPKSSRVRGVTKYQGKLGKVRKIVNKKLYIKTNPILSKLDKKKPAYPAPGCFDALKAPPIYGYGSRPHPNRSGVINLQRRGAGVSSRSAQASGIDCSSFISIALASQGLKLREHGPRFQSATTTGFHDILRKKDSCLKPAVFTENSSLREGDILNVKGSHIIMIESVGKDPLGIEKALKRGNCNSINMRRDFDFTYIHSGTTNNSVGPSIVSSKKLGSMRIFNNLRLAAIKTCKARQHNKLRLSTKSMGLSRSFSLFRHQSYKPQCRSKKRIKLKGENCAKQCNNV